MKLTMDVRIQVLLCVCFTTLNNGVHVTNYTYVCICVCV
jgi:hypothetical protein